jgi:hypothetical protein
LEPKEAKGLMRTLLKLLAPIGLGIVFLALVLMLQGCSLAKPREAPYVPPVESGDYTAVAVMDCNELKYVVFTDRAGKIDPIKVGGPASLLDLTLRLSKVNYSRVFVFENDRPCGYAPDEETL